MFDVSSKLIQLLKKKKRKKKEERKRKQKRRGKKEEKDATGAECGPVRGSGRSKTCSANLAKRYMYMLHAHAHVHVHVAGQKKTGIPGYLAVLGCFRKNIFALWAEQNC